MRYIFFLVKFSSPFFKYLALKTRDLRSSFDQRAHERLVY